MNLTPEVFAQTLVIPASVDRYLEANRAYLTEEMIARHSSVSRAYMVERVLARDWKKLQPYLPAGPKAVLDIGGGIGAVSLFAYRFLGQPMVTMVEKVMREVGGHKFDVHQAALDLFEANFGSASRLTLIDAKSSTFSQEIQKQRYDLVISLRALAFLFPYGTYREPLLKTFNPGGTLILDVRNPDSEFAKNSDESIRSRFEREESVEEVMRRLTQDFGHSEIIAKADSSVRVLVRRKP